MKKQVTIELSGFEVPNGVAEYHAILRIINPRLTYIEQVNYLLDAYTQLLEEELEGAISVFKRFFLSDAANQTSYLLSALGERRDGALSIVEQAPLDGTKIALWVYLQKGVQARSLSNGLFEIKHG